MAENFLGLERAKRERMEEIVSILDAFNGSLSLTDIMNYEIPVINGLKEAKSHINTEINRERQKRAQQAAAAKTQNLK